VGAAGVFYSERPPPSPDNFASPTLRGGQGVGQHETIGQCVSYAASDLRATFGHVDDPALHARMPILQCDPRRMTAPPARLPLDQCFAHFKSSPVPSAPFFADGPSRAVQGSRIMVEIVFSRAVLFFMGRKAVPA
jgi:hypothetical protein